MVGNFFYGDFQLYLSINGIRHETCAPYKPEQNGVSEHWNRTLMESAMSSLFDMDLPRDLWAEAANTSVYVNNRVHDRSKNSNLF
jgi:hypothetical protein